jgi:hypothetical protein
MTSNFVLHLEHLYSYKGMSISHLEVPYYTKVLFFINLLELNRSSSRIVAECIHVTGLSVQIMWLKKP